MNKEDMTNCPQCPNHCPKDNLMCGRGRAFFSMEESGHKEHGPKEKDEKDMIEDELIIHFLRKCGHALHHGQNLNPSELLATLSLEEKSNLIKLLKKIVQSF